MKIMKLHLLSILFCFLFFDIYFNNVIKKISTSLIYNGTGKKTLALN